MIRVLRAAAALLLLAASVAAFVAAHGTAGRLLAASFGLVSLLWSLMPFLDRSEAGQSSPRGVRRGANNIALGLTSAIVAIAAVRHSAPLDGVGSILAELAALFVWLTSTPTVVPVALAASGNAPGEEWRAERSYRRRRAGRLALGFAAGGASALAAFGLSPFLRVPYLLVSVLGVACCVLIVLLIHRFSVRPAPPDS